MNTTNNYYYYYYYTNITTTTTINTEWSKTKHPKCHKILHVRHSP